MGFFLLILYLYIIVYTVCIRSCSPVGGCVKGTDSCIISIILRTLAVIEGVALTLAKLMLIL